ncbi:hypothetical protein OK074_6272 [Actinobacteria bacterium OK074]|nr:hypothetical protein OK074_6272 [Actinobacteria bacterium OK074]
MHDGAVIPAAIVLSHYEQLERLRRTCPEAVPVAVVAGDPCLDQLRAALPFRPAYREALGVAPWQKLVLVSSTWGRDALLGSPARDTVRRALAELPADEYRVAVAVHPNAWFAHGPWQFRSWLAPLVDAGLLLPDPDTDTWKALLCAADHLIGDHGSLTLYGLALGLPVTLGAFAHARVAADSPMGRLGDLAPRIRSGHPLLAQLGAVPGTLRNLGGDVTSRPGESAALLRELFYTWLKLPEPERPATPRAVPLPPAVHPVRPVPCLPAQYVTVTHTPGGDALVRRYPAAPQGSERAHLAGAHRTADPDDPDRSLARSADVLLIPRGRAGAPDTLNARFPGHGLAAHEEPDGGCLALLPDGTRLRAHWPERPPWASFTLAASVLYDQVARHGAAELRSRVRVSEDMEPGLLVAVRA